DSRKEIGLGGREALAEIEFDVAPRTILERAEDLVAEPLIKRARLEAVRLQGHADGAALTRIGLGILEEPRSVSQAARRFRDPECRHVEPVTPDQAEQPAEHVAALAAQDEVDRKVARQAGHGAIVIVEAGDNELPRALLDERFERDP